jgi:ubiquitin C-terminal hydrolase
VNFFHFKNSKVHDDNNNKKLLRNIPMNRFKNFGNTCFIDSILQALFHLPIFVELIFDARIKCPSLNCTKTLFNLMTDQDADTTAINSATIQFNKLCKFLSQLESTENGYMQQQDCCEFLESFFELVNQEIFEVTNPRENYVSIDYVNKRKTLFHQAYNLNIIEQRTCPSNHESIESRDEVLIQLCLPENLKSININELLEMYFKTEKIEEGVCTEFINNRECKKQLSKRLKLFEPPNILVVQLKRFFFRDNIAHKNNINVQIQLYLEHQYFNENKYELMSIICHSGAESINFGHYTTFSKENDNNWYSFDDLKDVRCADLTSTDSDDYLTCTLQSYVLFYQKSTKPNDTLEQIFSQISITPKTADTKVLNKSGDNYYIDTDDDENFDKTLDSSEESEEEGDENNYVMVYSNKFFFNFNENDKSTSGIFSISNILERRLIRNDKNEIESNCWKEIEELELILKLNQLQLFKIDHKNVADLSRRVAKSIFLIQDGSHFYVVKQNECISIIFDPIQTSPQHVTNVTKFWYNLSRNPEKYLTVYEVVPFKSNSTVEINVPNEATHSGNQTFIVSLKNIKFAIF